MSGQPVDFPKIAALASLDSTVGSPALRETW